MTEDAQNRAHKALEATELKASELKQINADIIAMPNSTEFVKSEANTTTQFDACKAKYKECDEIDPVEQYPTSAINALSICTEAEKLCQKSETTAGNDVVDAKVNQQKAAVNCGRAEDEENARMAIAATVEREETEQLYVSLLTPAPSTYAPTNVSETTPVHPPPPPRTPPAPLVPEIAEDAVKTRAECIKEWRTCVVDNARKRDRAAMYACNRARMTCMRAAALK